MRPVMYLLVLCTACLFLLPGKLRAQTTTYIILRHAEKDTSAPGSTAMQADPPLSQKGRERAELLLDVLKEYKPDAIYSTNYTRTKATVAPLAKKFNKEVQLYDPRNLGAFAGQLAKEEGKTIIIVGHSNTAPALVNFLIKEKKYEPLDESIYNQFWVVTMLHGMGSAKAITY